ncbi:MAG TPA: hypothetical protein VFQ38_15635 [Longimicrobiales bacterium]|nr:hypothetical protein [Longimicrobiales bacterium]
MNRRPLLARLLLTVLAALHFALPGAAVVADARVVASASRWIGVHVEQQSCAHDRAAHPDDCALCQFVGHLAVPTPSAARTTLAAVLRAPAPAGVVVAAGEGGLSLPRSRAPPLS